MDHNDGEGVRLEFSGGRPPLTNLAEISKALAPFGSRIWPLDLRTARVAKFWCRLSVQRAG